MAENILTKAALIEHVAVHTNSSKVDVQDKVDAILAAMTETLSQDGKVTLPGFGNFEVVERKARDGRNPQTGEKLRIDASKTVKFKVAKQLKEAVQ
ncbi:MAG: DNA-binding protein [Legionellales bacterium]|nr:DNA-binding protein [Legionellales bacterium]